MDQGQVQDAQMSAESPELALLGRLRDQLQSVYFGNTRAVERLMTCLLARGHLLIEDVPGVGKTVLATALAKSIGGSFARVQCTPDLLPSDITGVTVFDRERNDFRFQPGPIFNNVIVADEVNRTTPRTQSALLEAMAEDTVTVDGVTRDLPAPFMVIATQNPYEFEGTYFLPENQLDRFLLRISLGYPAPSDEARVILKQPARTQLKQLEHKGSLMLRRLWELFHRRYVEGKSIDGQFFQLLPAEQANEIEGMETPGERARLVCDFLAGMTDGYAVRMYQRLFSPGFGSIGDLVG